MFHTYIASEVSVVVGSRPASGIADGTFVRIERTNDAFSMKEGADGEVTRSKSGSKSGTITITLEQASAYNDYLSSLAITDELTGAGMVPILVRDAKGTSLFTSPAAWVRKMPDTEFGKESGPREWVFDCSELEFIVGGN
jgi:hypothetical protein